MLITRTRMAFLALLIALAIGWASPAIPSIAGSAGARSKAGRESALTTPLTDASLIAGSAGAKGRAGRESS